MRYKAFIEGIKIDGISASNTTKDNANINACVDVVDDDEKRVRPLVFCRHAMRAVCFSSTVHLYFFLVFFSIVECSRLTRFLTVALKASIRLISSLCIISSLKRQKKMCTINEQYR